ncbi:Lsr2 family protein [Rhodococcus hoagii]|nr:Lsr2 family protein [Prescottella equi]NKS71654.1 Lsr2 family protein [Prescottella equi]
MAKKFVVELIDDLDGEPIDTGGETISFAVNGVEYIIDLNDKNATEFHRKLDYYIKYGTRVGGRRATRPATIPSNRADTKQIRQWANANGYSVAARGRIPAEIVAAYAAAN